MDTDQFEEEYECWSVSGIKEELLKSNIEYSGKSISLFVYYLIYSFDAIFCS